MKAEEELRSMGKFMLRRYRVEGKLSREKKKKVKRLREKMAEVGMIVTKVAKFPKEEVDNPKKFKKWFEQRFSDEYSCWVKKNDIVMYRELTKEEVLNES